MTDKDDRLKELINWENHFEWKYLSKFFKPCRLIDFGCGYGFSDIYLAMNGFEVYGYDPNADKIETAKYILSNQAKSIQDRVTFSSVRWDANGYDLVWASHVFEHIPIAQWKGIFNKMFIIPVLISVPLGFAYDMPEHIHHWRTENDLIYDLSVHSGRAWTTSVDLENHVIRAMTT